MPATLVVATTAIPAQIPTEFAIGGYSLRLYEPLLLIALIWAVRQRPISNTVWRYLWPFLAVMGVAFFGLLFSNTIPRAVGDVRHLLIMVAALVVATQVINTPVQKMCLMATKGSLWVSAAMVVIASASGMELAGRQEQASLNYGGAESVLAAERILSPSTYLAVAVFLACLAALTHYGVTVRTLLPYLAPAAVIVLLAFSRNHLIGMAVAVAFALIAFRSLSSFIITVWRGAILVAGLAALRWVLNNVLYGFSFSSYISTQITSYANRVFDGISSSARRTDGSVLFRAEENYYLREAIDASPIFGHGWGYAYKPGIGWPGSFGVEVAPYYAHNFYYWLIVKAGYLGLIGFLWLAVAPLLVVIAQRYSVWCVATGAALAGFLAISFVAPMPNGSPTALVVGVLIGVVIALSRRQVPRSAPQPQPVTAV